GSAGGRSRPPAPRDRHPLERGEPQTSPCDAPPRMSMPTYLINYIELGAPDLAAAKAFYAAAFGWSFNDYGPGYAGIKHPAGEGELGGLDVATTPRPGGPLVLIESRDLDATLAAVITAGGTVTNGP